MIAEYQVRQRLSLDLPQLQKIKLPKYFEICEKLTRILIFTTGGISLMLE
jgi:hypothetical protein